MILKLWGLIIIYAPGPFLSRIKLITAAPYSPAFPSAHSSFFFHPPPPPPLSPSLALSLPLILLLIGLSEVSTSKRHLLSNTDEKVRKGQFRIYIPILDEQSTNSSLVTVLLHLDNYAYKCQPLFGFCSPVIIAIITMKNREKILKSRHNRHNYFVSIWESLASENLGISFLSETLYTTLTAYMLIYTTCLFTIDYKPSQITIEKKLILSSPHVWQEYKQEEDGSVTVSCLHYKYCSSIWLVTY